MYFFNDLRSDNSSVLNCVDNLPKLSDWALTSAFNFADSFSAFIVCCSINVLNIDVRSKLSLDVELSPLWAMVVDEVDMVFVLEDDVETAIVESTFSILFFSTCSSVGPVTDRFGGWT